VKPGSGPGQAPESRRVVSILKDWILAFAGMTGKRKFRLFTGSAKIKEE
jgi:hypothetical protein